jgi:hypothetical protein
MAGIVKDLSPAGPLRERQPDYPKGVACAGDTPPHYRPDMLWVGEHLYHLAERGQAITGPAVKVAELRQLPCWR